MLKKIFLGILALVVVLLVAAYLVLFPPFPITPAIARGLPNNFSKANEEFNRRVNAAFPLPMAVDELTERLSKQGFIVKAEKDRAVFDKSSFPCQFIWRIYWTAEEGSVSELKGRFTAACL